MSQRRSSSSSASLSSSSNSHSSSSGKPSPSSSPPRLLLEEENISINICPFSSEEHHPLCAASSSSTSRASSSSFNKNVPMASTATDQQQQQQPSSSSSSAAVTPTPSPSKCAKNNKTGNSTAVVSLYCPLICRPYSSSPIQQQSKAEKSSSTKLKVATSAKSFAQIFSTNNSRCSRCSPLPNSKRGRTQNSQTKNACCCCCSSCCCLCSSSSFNPSSELRLKNDANEEEEAATASSSSSSFQFTNNRRISIRRNQKGRSANANKLVRKNDGRLRQIMPILLLQFLWILPYLLFANYLERCLLPLRLYCYTDPDLLAVRRSLRPSPEACAAHFFASTGDYRGSSRSRRHQLNAATECPLNQSLAILLQPWRLDMENQEMKRVIVIRSAPRAHEYREFIRSSWKSAVERVNGPVIFVSGQDGTEMAAESAEHGDILQLSFDDSYRNLTLKMMGLYRFFTERTRVQQIVVINDDTIVNATALGTIFRQIEEDGTLTLSTNRKYLIGKVSRGYPRLVFPWLPWYVPAELYPHKCYPPFVQGSSFIISREAAEEVLRRVCDFPWRNIHLDDILMGITTNCLGISNLHRDGFDVGHSLDSFTVFHYQFSRHSAETLFGMFNSVRHLLHH